MSNGKDVKKSNSVLSTTVKTENQSSSRSSSPLVRLPSFRQPRDLTLGSGNVTRGGALGLPVSKNRKNYTPNLNVQRNKAKDEVKVKEEPVRSRSSGRGRGRGESGPGRGRGDRGRGRGANVIQLSSGVFSEGIAAKRRPGRFKEDYGSSSNYVPKPKLNLKQNYSADSKEEGQRLRMLLQDDFIDDPDYETDGIKPLQLPMIPIRKKTASKSISGAAVVKLEKADPEFKDAPSLSENAAGIQIKKEPEDDGPDFKPMTESEGEILFERRVEDLLGSREPEYILLQLPDCLPGLRPSVEEDGKNINGTSLPFSQVSDKSKISQCTLSTVPEGCIGKIQLMKSGRALLKLGSVSFPVSMGTQVGFRQDLVSVNLNESDKTGKMIDLGQIKARVVVTPDWETMLGKV